MNEVISLKDVSLWRRTQEEFTYDLKKTILSILEGKYRQPRRQLVLDQVNLTINRGNKIGIIGANGSGKSTLLKLIAGILQPTGGKVRVKGNIAPLIELGAGFELELSLVDNIIMYGVMLGFTRQEMKQRVDLILEFAELEEYRLAPVKALSSGMTARLGFAIATDISPDILILDEVLSVGDERFKHKCHQRMEKFWRDHVTILVVSHSMDFIRESCDQVLWLHHGKIQAFGKTIPVVDAYLDSVQQHLNSL